MTSLSQGGKGKESSEMEKGKGGGRNQPPAEKEEAMFKLQKGGGTGEALLGDSKKMFSAQGCFRSGLLPRTTTERQTGSIFIGAESEKKRIGNKGVMR